jgi:hypothetical protein
MNALSAVKERAWDAWNFVMTKAIAKTPRQKPVWPDGRIRKGIFDLKQLPIVTKLADKNLGMVPIRGEIFNNLLHTHLNSDTYVEIYRFPLEEIVRRLKKYRQHSQTPTMAKQNVAQRRRNPTCTMSFLCNSQVAQSKIEFVTNYRPGLVRAGTNELCACQSTSNGSGPNF